MRKNDEIGRCRFGGDKHYTDLLHQLLSYRTDIPHFTSFCLDGECRSFRVNINKKIDMVGEFFEKKSSGENESKV